MRTGITQLLPTGQADTIVQFSPSNDTYTDRVVSIITDEQVFGGVYTITLDNADETLNSKNYAGNRTDIYWGFVGQTGSHQAIVIVESQKITSTGGKLQLVLTCYDRLAQFSMYGGSIGGSLWNHPSQSSTALSEMVLPSGLPLPATLISAISAQYDKTVLQILTSVIGSTSGVTLTTVDNDGYISTQKPLVSGQDARSVIFQALQSTKSYLRPHTNADSLDIIQPDAHTSVYTYNTGTYFLSDVDEKTAVIPNTIIYHGIDSTRTLIQTNNASHGIDSASVSLVGTIQEHNDYDPINRENSSTQAQVDSKADIRIAKLQLSSTTGQLVAPMHCSQELFDAITILDDRYSSPKTITGYVFRIQRRFIANQGIYDIKLTLGGVETGYTPAGNPEISITRPVIPVIPPTPDFSNLLPAYLPVVIDLNFTPSDNDDISWSSGTITASNGTSWSINANSLHLGNSNFYYLYYNTTTDTHELSNTQTFSGANASDKILMAIVLKAPATNQMAMIVPAKGGKSPSVNGDNISVASITSSKIAVTELAAITANMGLLNAGEIRLGTGTLGVNFTGWRLWIESNIGRFAGYNNNVLQWYSDTDGKLYAGAGGVIIDVSGIRTVGNFLSIRYSAGSVLGSIYASSSTKVTLACSNDIEIVPSGSLYLTTAKPSTGTNTLGAVGSNWYNVYSQGLTSDGELFIISGSTSLVYVTRLAMGVNDVTGSRSIDTVYQIGTSCPVEVAITTHCYNGDAVCLKIGANNPPTIICGRISCLNPAVDYGSGTITKIIPKGWYYKLETVSGTPGKDEWIETNIGSL